MVEPLVTVGIPTYNRPDSLKIALECILNQSYNNLEIIVSDNASNGDNVKKELEYYKSKDARISYIIQTENIGVVANFLFVLAQAKGTYFMWMADDDFKDKNFISDCVHLLNNNPSAEIAFSNFATLSNPPKYYPFEEKIKKISNQNISKRLQAFIKSEDYYGKANLLYGIFRTKILTSFDLKHFLDKNPYSAKDNLIIFYILTYGNIVFSDKIMHYIGIDIPKEYTVEKTEKLSFWNKLLSHPNGYTLTETIGYYQGYSKIIFLCKNLTLMNKLYLLSINMLVCYRSIFRGYFLKK